MTPYWRVNEVPLPRVACGMISSAVLVQLNGWQSVFQLSMNLVIAPMRSVTELNAPRRIDCRVMMLNQVSIWLIHEDPTGVKWKPKFGFSVTQVMMSGVLWVERKSRISRTTSQRTGHRHLEESQ